MSRFFAKGSDSESDSSSDEELYGSSEVEESSEEESSEEEEDEEDEDEDEDNEDDSDFDEDKGPKPVYDKSKFLKGGAADSSSDEDSDDDRRVVKSAKDKLVDEIDNALKAIENGKRINDWIAISENFDKVNKLVERATKQYQTTPKQYIKALVELDSFAAETTKTEKEKEAKKRMNKSNSQAFNTVKQRVKKTNKEYQSLVNAYNEDADAFMSQETSASASVASASRQETPSGTTSTTADAAADSAGGFSTVGKGGKVAQYNSENLIKTLLTVAENRGKKNVDREEQVKILEQLLEVANKQSPVNAYHKISVLLMLVSVRFDLLSGSVATTGAVMSADDWKKLAEIIKQLFDTLEANVSEYRVCFTAAEPEDLEVGPTEIGPSGAKELPGSVSSLIERLDDELTRSLFSIDSHTTEYVERLGDEAELYNLILRGQIYLEGEVLSRNKGDKQKAIQSASENESLTRIIVRRLEHIYYKPTRVILTAEKEAWKSLPENIRSQGSFLTPESSSGSATELEDKEITINLVNSMCKVLYQQPNTSFRTKAMLSHIYHYALNDFYFKARDMFLMSHLQSSIHTAEPTIQVLYNRALVQVGLCAFKQGLITECQQSLTEICSSSKLKELLGQSNGERQRVLPFHMHINLDLVECAYLISSLLIEVPLMGAALNGSSWVSASEAKKKIVSKPFRRLLDYHNRQIFTGPPENNRDYIMHAAEALLAGNWSKAKTLLTSIKIWSLLPDPEKIRVILGAKVQEEGLKAYLFIYSPCYESLSLDTLASLFDLPITKVTAIVSKLVANEEIAAALDQTSNTIIFRQGIQPTKLQSLALALSDKAVQIAERNERLASGGFQLDSQSQQPQNSDFDRNKRQQSHRHQQPRTVRT